MAGCFDKLSFILQPPLAECAKVKPLGAAPCTAASPAPPSLAAARLGGPGRALPVPFSASQPLLGTLSPPLQSALWM